MLLKLKKIILLSGLGLITIGAITPVIASCGKSSKNNVDPEFVYTSESVKNLFEQFIDSYRNLPRAEGVSEDDVEAEILEFKAQLAQQEADTANLPDDKKFTLRSEWIIDLAKQYDIVLVEWQQVDNIRDSLFEGVVADGGYGDESVAASLAQQELIDQGIDNNQSFNEYLDTVAEVDSNFIDYSSTLFPRTHAYALHASGPLKPINRNINAVAAKANLLSQMIGDSLQFNDEENIVSYLANEENSPFQDGFLKYNTIGTLLDHTQTKTALVGEDGNYINSKNTAYRLLSKTAQTALFNYSYLDLDAAQGTHTIKPFVSADIFADDHYVVDIAVHVKSPESSELLAVENYSDFSITFEYDVVVTDTYAKFSPFKNQFERYDTGADDIPYFALVGSRTAKVSMPADVQAEHNNNYLSDTLKYDAAHPESVVKALGVTFSNIKKNARGTDGRPTDASKLTEDDINHFYFLTVPAEEQENVVSFTSQYGTNGEIDTVKNKWLTSRDADAAVHLQIDGFTNSPASYFGSEYVDAQGLDKTPKFLTISDANAFLEQTLGRNSLQFGVKIEDSGVDEDKDVFTGSYVKLGVYLGKVVENPSIGQDPLTDLIPVAAHNNVDNQLSETTQLESWKDYYKAQAEATNPTYAPNQFYLPLFTSARQASNMKFCAGLLEKDNLAKHAKIIEFIEAPIIEKFTNHLKHLATTNAVYASLNIAMTVAYAIKLVYDVFILSSCWAVFPLALAAGLQIASDLMSIGFLIYEIYNTYETIDKLEAVIRIFVIYYQKLMSTNGSNYKAVKKAYDAYLAQLFIYSDITKSPSVRATAADLVANGLYNKFMVLLTDNLCDLVNDSLKLASGLDEDFGAQDSDLGWGAVKGVAELAPFLIESILRIIILVIYIACMKVGGVVVNKMIEGVMADAARLVRPPQLPDPGHSFITQGRNRLLAESYDNAVKGVKDMQAYFKQLSEVKSMMKISGIAGIILGVMDILFTVGYSIATSIIASDINELLNSYLLK